MKEIASAVGTPISIDGPTRNRTFGHYARILVDIDLSKRVYDEILVEREGFAFKVEVKYERRPLFCHHCYVIGHNVTNCKWLNPEAAKVNDRGKKQVPETNNQPRVVKGASSSGTLRYVPVVPPPTAATIDATTTQADVPPPIVVTADATATQPTVPVAATTHGNATQFVVPTAATTNENVTQPLPQRDVAAGSFRHILQDVLDAIPQGTLPRPDIPVLELAAIVEHDDVQKSLEAATLTVTSNEKVHSVPIVSVPPFYTIQHIDVHDDMDDNVSQNRERSPISTSKGANDSIPFDLAAIQIPSQDMRPPLPVIDPIVNASTDESQDNTTSGHAITITSPEKHSVEHVDVHTGSGHSLVSPVIVERSLAVSASMPTTSQEEQVVAELQQQEVHPSKNIQHGLDLWDRVREYDARSAVEDFTTVLTRKQKQKIKLQQDLAKQPTKTRSRGGTHHTAP